MGSRDPQHRRGTLERTFDAIRTGAISFGPAENPSPNADLGEQPQRNAAALAEAQGTQSRQASANELPAYGDPRLPSRFWAKVVIGPSGCWVWAGGRTGRGYGQLRSGGVQVGAHRLAYEALCGPIPDGLVIDHLCRNKVCVNPAHLEVVTGAENTRRGCLGVLRVTHCPRGHEYTEANTIRDPKRRCRECTVARRKARWATEVGR